MEEMSEKIEENILDEVIVAPSAGQGCAVAEDPIVEVQALVKDFKKNKAVDDITFTVNRGDAFGFIGPNGAGKTTTIKILTTLLNPTEGKVKIDGVSVVDEPDKVRKIIGYMPDYFGVYDGLKVWE
ncbi:MAG: ATP-binding cassette domain-containing protein, partial [Vulcanimicrobiota bacterium]